MKAADLITNLLKKAGITHEAITDEVPDDVATQLDNSLLTIQAATNNHPQVKKVYFAQAYNGLDAEIETLMNEYELDETARTALKTETSSTKRAVALVKKIKELEAAKAAQAVEKAGPLQQQINELHEKLRVEKETLTNTRKEYDKKIRDIHIRSRQDALVSGYQTVYDDLPVEAKNAAINALIEKSLQENDAEFALDERGSFVINKKDGTNLFGDNHTQLTPQAFIDKSLSKILRVNGAATTPAAGNNYQNPSAVTTQSGGATKNAALSAKIAESLNTYKQAAQQAVQG